MNQKETSFFSKDCIEAINNTFNFAKDKKFEFVTIDHLMIFLSQTKKGKNILSAMNINVPEFQRETINYLDENIPKISLGENEKPQISITFQQTLERATLLTQAAGVEVVDEGYIIVALFELGIEDTFVLNYFEHYSVTRFDIMNYLTSGKPKENTRRSQTKRETTSFLSKFTVLLNEKVKDGKIDPVVGREEEINKVVNVLAQRRKNNPILVGEPGVGKTSIAEGLALKIVRKEVPEQLQSFKIHSLDLTAVIAGTRYRGDFEERLKGIIKEAQQNPEIVLFIDEIHTLVGTGSGTGTMDAGNILKPALSNGELKIIGATTYDEYRKIFEKEGALSRRFQKVDILEPNETVSITILNGIKTQYETFHNVVYTEDAIEAAVKLSSKYINNRRLPDKAIDIIDMAGAKIKLTSKDKTISKHEIHEIISDIVRVPVADVESDEKAKLMNLEEELNKEIFGQKEAIEQIVDTVIYSRGIGALKSKPIGSFLFAGPSGVGKTELSKQLAEKLGIPFLRLDMSEYMEKHNVSRLVGAPPGYVGYEQGGQLTELINKNPHCVLLLDEIEKAHRDIYNILLQIMDYAVLTDNNGNKFDFKNVILVMTSNLGAGEINRNKLGFTQEVNLVKDRNDIIKKSFTPEFYNRLDSVIHFNPLTEENVINVIDKHLNKLQDQLTDKKVILITTPKAKEFISKNGFDAKLGARPIERYIEKEIAKPLSREIVFGKLDTGGEIKVDVVNDQLKLSVICSYSENETKAVPVKKPRAPRKPRAAKVKVEV